MYQHPSYPWMLADLDYLVEMPDGSIAILECKTTNYNAKENWFRDGEEIVPIYYESQGRHYMAVTNISRVYFCCLYGNNEKEAVIRHIDRDMSYEAELIALEDDFWHRNVLGKCPPPYTEDGDLILDSLKRQPDLLSEKTPVIISPPQFAQVARFLELQQEKSVYDAKSRQLEKEMTRLKALIATAMGKSYQAVYTDSQLNYTITFKPTQTPRIYKEDLNRMKAEYPDVYDKYVTVSPSKHFSIKKSEITPVAA